jgi:ferredoxin-nitrite reductase
VAPADVTELVRAVAQTFAELGNRENRGLARMRYLVEERGPEGFRTELVSRLHVADRRGAERAPITYRRDHVGVHPQRQEGLHYVGACVPAGRLSGADLQEAARLAERYGDGTVRLGIDQNFILSGVPTANVDDLLDEGLLQTYSPSAGPFTRGVVACTGNEFCRYAITETKSRAVTLARRLDEQLSPAARQALDDQPVRIHLSGCSASCAQPQIADVALRGAVHKSDVALEEAYDVGLGGSLGEAAGFAHWAAGAVPARSLEATITRVVDAFVECRHENEGFTEFARRVPLVELRQILTGRGS